MLKLVSWNVNGFKSILDKNFEYVCKNMNADIFCLQETKLQKSQTDYNMEGYISFWNCADKKGYSGTAIFTKTEPLNINYGLGVTELDDEGRIITLEFEDYYLVNVYTPCYQKEIKRKNFRELWDDEFINYIENLENSKDVIICGDFNIAYQSIDIGNSEKNIFDFSDEERHQFATLMDDGFIDTFRYKNPTWQKFTWWQHNKREQKDSGCRLDYFLVSRELENNIVNAQIRNDIGGSDHCPIVLKLNIK